MDEEDNCAFCMENKKENPLLNFVVMDTSRCCKSKYILCEKCVLEKKGVEKCMYNCPSSYPNNYQYINYPEGTMV